MVRFVSIIECSTSTYTQYIALQEDGTVWKLHYELRIPKWEKLIEGPEAKLEAKPYDHQHTWVPLEHKNDFICSRCKMLLSDWKGNL